MKPLGIFFKVVIKNIHINLYKMAKGPTFVQPTTKIIHINLCIIVQNVFVVTVIVHIQIFFLTLSLLVYREMIWLSSKKLINK